MAGALPGLPGLGRLAGTAGLGNTLGSGDTSAPYDRGPGTVFGQRANGPLSGPMATPLASPSAGQIADAHNNAGRVQAFNTYYDSLSPGDKVRFNPSANTGTGSGALATGIRASGPAITAPSNMVGVGVKQDEIHDPTDLSDPAIAGINKENARQWYMNTLHPGLPVGTPPAAPAPAPVVPPTVGLSGLAGTYAQAVSGPGIPLFNPHATQILGTGQPGAQAATPPVAAASSVKPATYTAPPLKGAALKADNEQKAAAALNLPVDRYRNYISGHAAATKVYDNAKIDPRTGGKVDKDGTPLEDPGTAEDYIKARMIPPSPTTQPFSLKAPSAGAKLVLGTHDDVAKAFLAAAGGDQDKARELAKENGWTF